MPAGVWKSMFMLTATPAASYWPPTMMCTGPCVYQKRHSFIDETDVLLKHIFMSALASAGLVSGVRIVEHHLERQVRAVSVFHGERRKP